MFPWLERVCLVVANLVIGGVLVSCVPPSDGFAALVLGPYTVHEDTFSWYDADRQREIPIRMYAPVADDGPFPVIVFSPGLGNTRDHYTSLGQHWASHGYVAVFMTHLGMDDSVIYGDDRNLIAIVQAVLRIIEATTYRWDPPADVSFVLDRLEEDRLLRNVADMQRVGVAGHSFGAFAALAMIGMRIDGADEMGLGFLDPRVRAVVALSPPGPGVLGLRDDAWDTIQMPCMSIVGTLDVDPITDRPVRRRAAFLRSPAPDQYLVTLQYATHGVYDHESPWLVDRLSYPQHHPYIELVTTAFFDAYLKHETQAQGWLLDGVLEDLSRGACQLEYKHVTPIDDGAWPAGTSAACPRPARRRPLPRY